MGTVFALFGAFPRKCLLFFLAVSDIILYRLVYSAKMRCSNYETEMTL